MSHVEDFNQLRLMVKELVRTPFQEGWQFRLVIDDENAPEDLNIYIKDITYGSIEIETEEIKAGMQTLTYPSGTAPVSVSVTMRDNQDRRVYDWFKGWAYSTVNDDGTVNLPYEYCRKIYRVNLLDDLIQDTWYAFPTKLGDITEAIDAEGFLEFPVTFIQFRSREERK